MASLAEWVEGARLRTLPAAISPVLAGSAVAVDTNAFHPWLATMALIVALALQLGANYANDYSDGIRGTDDRRVGPLRLVGSGAAKPNAVRTAAFAFFVLAGFVGLVLVWWTQHWWLLAVGAACIAAAWFYTGGSHPYGYAGWGEFSVFFFFGIVAVCGTAYIQVGMINGAALLASIAMGSLACAILTANNLRDLETDRLAQKHTLPTRLGDSATRFLFVVLIGMSVISLVLFAALTSWWALGSASALIFLVPAACRVRSGARGKALIQVLRDVGLGQLVAASVLFVVLVIERMAIQ